MITDFLDGKYEFLKFFSTGKRGGGPRKIRHRVANLCLHLQNVIIFLFLIGFCSKFHRNFSASIGTNLISGYTPNLNHWKNLGCPPSEVAEVATVSLEEIAPAAPLEVMTLFIRYFLNFFTCQRI